MTVAATASRWSVQAPGLMLRPARPAVKFDFRSVCRSQRIGECSAYPQRRKTGSARGTDGDRFPPSGTVVRQIWLLTPDNIGHWLRSVFPRPERSVTVGRLGAIEDSEG